MKRPTYVYFRPRSSTCVRAQSPFHARIGVIIIIIVIIVGFSTRMHSLSLLARQEIPAGERYSDRRAISVNNVLLLRHGSGWLYTYTRTRRADRRALKLIITVRR